MKAARLKGVTVYEAEDENWCQRSFVLSETVTVSLAVGLGVPARVRCPVVGEVALRAPAHAVEESQIGGHVGNHVGPPA